MDCGPFEIIGEAAGPLTDEPRPRSDLLLQSIHFGPQCADLAVQFLYRPCHSCPSMVSVVSIVLVEYVVNLEPPPALERESWYRASSPLRPAPRCLKSDARVQRAVQEVHDQVH